MIRSSVDVFRAAVVAAALVGVARQAQGADVSAYSVRKGLVYEQTSSGAPVANAFIPAEFLARVDANTAVISGVSLSTPSDIFPSVDLDSVGDHYEFMVPGSEEDVNSFFPNGNYSFTLNGGTTVAKLTLGAGAFPTAVPQLLNFDAAQNISPGSSFTLTFSPFTGAGAGDTYEFEVLDSDSAVLFSKSGAPVTSVVIPAGTLSADQSYSARLRFVHSTVTDTTTLPGATGSAGYFKENQFSISTGTGGGGGGDTTPPSLVATTPANATTGVAVSSPILFVFSEPMARQQSIQWSANVTPANFTYSWGTGDLFLTATYSGGLPANSTITWALTGGATGFKDAAGNALAAGAAGSFTTGASGGGGTNNPCISTNEPNADLGSGAVFKSLEFVQTGNTAPTPDPGGPASAVATYKAAKNQSVTAVKVTGPNNLSLTLSNLFGTYFAFQQFPSAATMDAALPAGNYTITATGAGTGTLAVPSVSTIPVPRISNLAEFVAANPAQAFTLQFAPFTGAAAEDSISIIIEGENGDHFYAPDYCLNRLLPNTATSVVIPANTFKAGEKLQGSITFSKFSVNGTAIPNTTLSAGGSVNTKFEFTTGGSGAQVRWTTPVINPNGSITFTAQAPAGTNLIVQRSTNLKDWANVQTLPATAGTISFTVTDSQANRAAFYRAQVQ